jgi:hypothetical protein
VIVSSGGKDYSARITNIAPMGAMLEVSAPLFEGTSLLLRCGSIDVHAMVVWTKDLRMGVNFSTKLSERQVAEQLSRAVAADSCKSRMSRGVSAISNAD